MSKPFFIWTMRRTGGTSLTNLLMQMSEYKEVEHEPFNRDRVFANIAADHKEQFANKDTVMVKQTLRELFADKPLIKHCYEIADINFNKVLVTSLKDTEYKHIFLSRRDEVSRMLSLCLAYQTNVWGKHGSEKMYEMIKSGKRLLEPFNMDHVKEEAMIAIQKTRRVQELLTQNSMLCKVVYFEDFFVGERHKRLHNLNKLFSYLEFDTSVIQRDRDQIEQALFSRSQKSNRIIKYVPNHKEVKAMLENIVTSSCTC